MSEEKVVNPNPFDDETFKTGGGFWDGKQVTITKSYTGIEEMTYADGTPVLGKDKKPIRQVSWILYGIAEDSEKERKEVYSAGDKVRPTADGKGFESVDGSPVTFHANSNVAKLAKALKTAGYDIGQLFPEGKQDVSKLVGARLAFVAVQKVGQDGKPLKDKKGYNKNAYYPSAYIGQTGLSAAPAAAGNGAADDVAVEAVLAVLAEAEGGKKTRIELVRGVTKKLQGKPELFAAVQKVGDDKWHKDKPWKYDGLTASL